MQAYPKWPKAFFFCWLLLSTYLLSNIIINSFLLTIYFRLLLSTLHCRHFIIGRLFLVNSLLSTFCCRPFIVNSFLLTLFCRLLFQLFILDYLLSTINVDSLLSTLWCRLFIADCTLIIYSYCQKFWVLKFFNWEEESTI